MPYFNRYFNVNEFLYFGIIHVWIVSIVLWNNIGLNDTRTKNIWKYMCLRRYLSNGHIGSTNVTWVFQSNFGNAYNALLFEYFSAYHLYLFCRRVAVNNYSKQEVRDLRKHFLNIFSSYFISKQSFCILSAHQAVELCVGIQ